jgi:hypothetical protein
MFVAFVGSKERTAIRKSILDNDRRVNSQAEVRAKRIASVENPNARILL